MIRVFRQKLRLAQEAVNRKVDELNQRVARYTSEQLFEGLMGKYQTYPKVLGFIHMLQKDVQDNFEGFLTTQDTSAGGAAQFTARYAVNLLVDNEEARGGPVIEEVKIIRPARRAFMCGRAAWAARKVPFRFTARTWSHSAGSMFSIRVQG